MSYIELTISKEKVKNNIQKIRQCTNANAQIMAISKANAYGLGAAVICPEIADEVDYFGFATLDEALEVREKHAAVKITLLSEPRRSDIPILAKNHIDCGVYSRKCIDNLNKYLAEHPDETIATHFKCNTGLNRLGTLDVFGPDSLLTYWLDHTVPNLQKISLWSHLQNSELGEEHTQLNEMQLYNFMQMTEKVAKKYNLLRHFSNSYAIEFLDDRFTFDMVRGGVMIWQNTFELKVQVKHVFTPPAGTTVGYGCTDITPHKHVCDGIHKAASLAIGYADGLSTRLSHQGYVMFKGVKCEIISPVMMDMTVVKVPADLEIEDEDWVTLIGNGDSEAMTTQYMQSLTGENSRELMAHLGRRIMRRVV